MSSGLNFLAIMVNVSLKSAQEITSRTPRTVAQNTYVRLMLYDNCCCTALSLLPTLFHYLARDTLEKQKPKKDETKFKQQLRILMDPTFDVIPTALLSNLISWGARTPRPLVVPSWCSGQVATTLGL